MEERRSTQRLRTNLNARWESLKSQGRGSVCDLSAGGCFVLSGGEVKSGELIQMQLFVEDQIVALWGQVIYVVSEMGFAVRFVFAQDDEQHVRSLIENLAAAD
jgi:hypothetical protein